MRRGFKFVPRRRTNKHSNSRQSRSGTVSSVHTASTDFLEVFPPSSVEPYPVNTAATRSPFPRGFQRARLPLKGEKSRKRKNAASHATGSIGDDSHEYATIFVSLSSSRASNRRPPPPLPASGPLCSCMRRYSDADIRARDSFPASECRGIAGSCVCIPIRNDATALRPDDTSQLKRPRD